MARDRQRAKQRKQRQAPQPPSRTDGGDGRARDGEGVAPEPDHLHRENVPGPWEHGGEADRFGAELVAGADGEPEADPDAAERASTGQEPDADPALDADPAPDPDPEPAGATAMSAGTGSAPPPAGGGLTATGSGPAEPARGKGGLRFVNFLRACWAELQRVQWPNRRQVGQATMVVLGFLVIAGAFLGAADYVAGKIVDLIL